jgi:hypothetical protein
MCFKSLSHPGNAGSGRAWAFGLPNPYLASRICWSLKKYRVLPMSEPRDDKTTHSARPWASPAAQTIFGKALLHAAKQTGDRELERQGRANLKTAAEASKTK